MTLSNPTGSDKLVSVSSLPIENGKAIGWNGGAIANLTLFDPANPGAIGGTTPSMGRFTELVYNPAAQVRIRADANLNFVNGNTSSNFTNSYYNFFQGWHAGLSFQSGSHNFLLGNLAGQNLQTGSNNFFAGSYAGSALTFSDNNFLFGYAAGYQATSLSNTMLLGTTAGYNLNTASNTTFLGIYAGFETQTANNSFFLGYGAGYKQINSESNLYLGSLCAFFNASGDFNTIVGGYAFYDSLSGTQNTALGYQALRLTTGLSGCVAIGCNAGLGETESNRLHIANTSSKSLIYGQFDKGNIGINTKSFAGAEGSLGLLNRTVPPTGNAVNGCVISIASGEPKYLGTTGTERDIVTSPSPIPIRLLQATVATLPAAAVNNNGIAIVSDEPSNDRFAICDGSNWLFIPTTRSPISPGRRLTLTSNTSFTSSDQTGNIIYYTSHENDAIPLWDGTRSVWRVWRGGEISRTLGTTPTIQSNIPANTNFNIYISWGGGSPTMLLEPWTNSAIGTQVAGSNNTLTRRDGLVVRSSDNALFVGTGRTTAANTVVVNKKQIFLSNVYNRTQVEVKFLETTVSWSPTVTTAQPWGNRSGNTTAGEANRIEVVNCDDVIFTNVFFTGIVKAASGALTVLGLKVDATTSIDLPYAISNSITVDSQLTAQINKNLGVGYHYIQAMQLATITTSVFSSNSQAGVTGSHYY